MKTIFMSLVLLFCYVQLMAQDTYRKEKMNVMGTSYSGFSIQLPYGEQKTRDYLLAYLKDGGKISEKRNYIEIRENYWRQKNAPSQVYAQVVGNQTESRIWIGYSQEADESFIASLESQMESLPFLMHKQHLQAQIKEAEAAASFLSKELKQAEREAQRLSQRMERNVQEKARLEQALDLNQQEKTKLKEEVSGNDKTQEDKSQALEEVKKQLEYLQEKLRRL
jgi:chromosome segregation ATPase